MKTRINQVAVAAIFALLFIGGNSYAKGTGLIASRLKTIEEPALKMENWMTDDATWNNANTVFFFEEATEESLVLESWMTNEKLWETESITYTEKENDDELVLEFWMTNDETWNLQ